MLSIYHKKKMREKINCRLSPIQKHLTKSWWCWSYRALVLYKVVCGLLGLWFHLPHENTPHTLTLHPSFQQFHSCERTSHARTRGKPTMKPFEVGNSRRSQRTFVLPLTIRSLVGRWADTVEEMRRGRHFETLKTLSINSIYGINQSIHVFITIFVFQMSVF